MHLSITLENLPQKASRIIRPPSSTRPIIWLVEEKGKRLIVKDFSRNSFFYRNLFGRFLIWREAKAYRRLAGIQGVPRYYGVLEGIAIVTEFVEGKTVKQAEEEGGLGQPFFQKLKELLDAFHKRGIAHCDLKRTPNVLVSPDGNPFILDWAASVSASECRIYPLTKIYERLVRDDEMALIKMRLRHVPETVSAREKAMYNNRSTAEKLIRSVRDRLRRLLQRIA
ncbi:MAG: hypothetical protein DRH12_08025 [Deltaproteobacteria bacterium]|nr:MAG: hypothetical protein DRH12_08025 [Deltaproteobacteria bacterium]